MVKDSTVSVTPPPLPPRRFPSPAQLGALVARQPRLWWPLLVWALAVLGLAFLRHVLFPGAGTAVTVVEALLVLSAIGALGLFAALARRFYLRLRQVRNFLFEGNYESARDLARHYPALAVGLGLEAALDRLLAFDRRRAEKVAAATRLFDRLLREIPLPLFVGLLEDDVVRFSRELCRLLDISTDQLPLDSLLLPSANRHFAHVWDQVASGRKSSINTTATLQLPIAHEAVPLRLRLLGVQNDQGKLAYILGLAEPAGKDEPAEAGASGAENEDVAPVQPPNGGDSDVAQGESPGNDEGKKG